MALVGIASAIAERRALAIIAADWPDRDSAIRGGNPLSASALARRMLDVPTLEAPFTYSEAQGVATRALRASAAAERMQDDLDLVIPRSQLPRTGGLAGRSERAMYRVIVRIPEGDGGYYEYAVDVHTDATMSARSIEQMVQDTIDLRDTPTRATKAAIANVADRSQVQVRVVAAWGGAI